MTTPVKPKLTAAERNAANTARVLRMRYSPPINTGPTNSKPVFGAMGSM